MLAKNIETINFKVIRVWISINRKQSFSLLTEKLFGCKVEVLEGRRNIRQYWVNTSRSWMWSWIPAVMAVKRVRSSLQIYCCSAYLCTCQKSLFKCTWCLKSVIRSGSKIAPNSTETWSAEEKEISQSWYPLWKWGWLDSVLNKDGCKWKFQICLRVQSSM